MSEFFKLFEDEIARCVLIIHGVIKAVHDEGG